jgi:hypothetical protein
MTRVRRICSAWVLLGTLCIPPLSPFVSSARAHAPDLLTARLVFDGGPEVSLEITADVAQTPWLRDAANPAQAMGSALRVTPPEGRSWSPSELGPPKVSVHQGFQHPAPQSMAHGEGDPKSELLTAAWKWRPSVSPLRFEVPKDHPANILLWAVNHRSPDPSPKGQLLLASDKSAPCELPFKPTPLQWNWKARLAASVAVCGIALQSLVIFVRFRKRRMA